MFPRQSGQALVYILAMLAPIVIVTAYVNNAFTVSNEKTRLQNTTDAVAYSVATIEARDLNFKAYTNRAMIAQQTSIARMVSLMSWSRYAFWLSLGVDQIGKQIPLVNIITGGLANTATGLHNTLSGYDTNRADATSTPPKYPFSNAAGPNEISYTGPSLSFMINTYDASIQGLSTAQTAMHVATINSAIDAMDRVARLNDANIDVTSSLSLGSAFMLGDYALKHNRFTRSFDPDPIRNSGRRMSDSVREHFDRVEEFRNITLASRDGFSANRNQTYFAPEGVAADPVEPYRVQRRGGTDLTGSRNAKYGNWIAMDTLSLHQRKLKVSSFRVKRNWEEIIVLGYGAAKAFRSDDDKFFSAHNGRRDVGGSWRSPNRGGNPYSSELAADYHEAGSSFGNFSGLQRFFDLTNDGRMVKGPGIRILLSKRLDDISTTKRQGFNAQELDIEADTDPLGDSLNAVASAEPYFARINDLSSFRRSDGRREYANLYNPFWIPRLKSLSGTELLVLQGVVGANL